MKVIKTKEIILNELNEVIGKISKFRTSYSEMSKGFESLLQEQFNQIFKCVANKGSVVFHFGQKHTLSVNYLHDIGMGDNNVYFTSYTRGSVCSEEEIQNTRDYLYMYSILINNERGREVIQQIHSFWKSLENFSTNSRINFLEEERVSLEKKVKNIENKETIEDYSKNEYFEVINNFSISNNTKMPVSFYRSYRGRSKGRSRESVKMILSKSIIRLDSISKRKINFNITILNKTSNENLQFTNIHFNYIKSLLEKGYIRNISAEDVMESAMDTFQKR
jgi:hypothetical protein